MLVLLQGILPAPSPARAVEAGKDWWFVETITLADVVLPEGVTIRSSNPATQSRGSLILENHSETLLFVLSINYKDVLVMVTPDPNWKARVNVAHEVASYLVAPAKPANLTMDALTDLDPALVDQNVLSLEPPPAGVTIPTPQESELLLVYGAQVLVVPFTLSYTLNSNFNNGVEATPQRTASPQAAAGTNLTATPRASGFAAQVDEKTIIVLGLAGIAVLLIAGWLIFRGFSRSR